MKIKKLLLLMATLLIAVLLYLSSLYNYLLFHSLVEIFSISIAFTIFAIAWNSNKYMDNNYLLILGVSYLFIGTLDLFHTLSYKGMQIFTDYDYYANQLWISARYFESLVFLIAAMTINISRRFSKNLIFTINLFITSIILATIFLWKVFPVCFIEGVGLTNFKIYSEYIISAILLASIWVIIKNKKHFSKNTFRLTIFALIATIISELAFTFYISNYGISNLIGHYFKIISFYLIYKAIIEKGVKEPFEVLFYNLKESKVMYETASKKDDLTGLLNRRAFWETISEEHSRSVEPHSIVMIDIDDFKRVNDMHGHLAGDYVLKTISNNISDNIRKDDILVRWGGEEFLILMRNTTIEDAGKVTEKIRKQIKKLTIEYNDININLTISAGIDTFTDIGLINNCINIADENLYLAKQNNKDSVYAQMKKVDS